MSTKCQYRPPISTGVWYSGVKQTLPGCEQKPGKNTEPNDHVQRVQSGHDEIEREEIFPRGVGWHTGRDAHGMGT